MVHISGSAVLVTGANRGIGRALVEEALSRGARRVYAGTREPWTHPDTRVTPLTLDITDSDQIRSAVGAVESLDVLVNNAGIALYDDLDDRSAIERQLVVNLFGPFEMARAFQPLLARSKGAIVNNLSLAALAPMPITPAYSISKAAAFSLTQSLRVRVADQGVTVHAVLTGPTDTDMNRGFDIPKTAPEAVARAIFDGVEKGEEEIFPDPISQAIADGWRNGVVKALEREFAQLAGTPIPDEATR
ncbi:MAG: short-chain dehydrogenase [Nocardia sp.]|uniref:SDR family NAD(P)-dependent oxidoreductase n=1 Tax=Nocardia sp. TaxID=1821 RepID=UPI00260D315A|nr:SDR family NAD(P)-dependent oxidoreductase [Nocardia sp.]MCU1647324.1 short-chain dehydrogenase [Nocardia sp.]